MSNFLKRNKATKGNDPNVVSLSHNDATLQTFKNKAQEELPYLISFMVSHKKNEDFFRYAVKANFIEDDKAEHMWVQVSDFDDGYFIGRLANEPVTVKLIKYVDAVKVSPKNVEDWILEDFLTNTKVGSFSREYVKAKKH
jgi:uncharacterized protein YegJ (DUF2314 family)